MAIITKPVKLFSATLDCPVVVREAVMNKPVKLRKDSFDCPIKLSVPEAPLFTDLDFEFDSPMV